MSSPVPPMPSPLLDIIAILQRLSKGTGTIKIPAKIWRNTKRYLSEQPYLLMTHVEGIVASLEHEESALCRRLDPAAFLMIYKILSLAEECLAYQRGLSLLSQSLHEISTSSSLERRFRAVKKIKLGEEALIFLVGCFVKDELLRGTRRWMGILALELLMGCDKNQTLLLDKAPSAVWRCLGDLILEENCQILKILAGLILQEMWPDGAPSKELWPKQGNSKISGRLPKYCGQMSQWVIEFQKFVARVAPRSRDILGRSEVAFAYAVSLGELAYSVNEGSAILVTVSDELNIVIPATATSLAKYIDICTEKIEGATIEIREPQSQSSSLLPNHSHILTIWMSKSPDITFRVNAYSHAADSINLAFTSLEAAAMVQHSVLGKRSRTFRDTQTIQLSQAQPIDVSKYPHETDGAAVLYTATNSARALSNVLENTAIGANMPSEQHPIVSVAHLSLPKANPECQLNHDNYLQEQCSIPLRQEMLVPLYETFVDDDTIPLPPCQFAKPNVSTPTTEYDVPSTPENGISRAPIPAFGSLVDGDRCSLSKDCVEDRISAKGLPVEQDEDNESLRPSAHNVPAKQANQPNQRLHKSLELQALETNALEPESAAGDHGEQSCHKLIDPVRRNIGEEVIGPSLISDWGAPKADDKKVETPKSSLKRKASFADQCGTGSRKISRFQSMVNPAKGSGKVSTDGQDGAQFDFPTSAHKPRLLTTAYLPTSTRALNAPNSSKPVTNPKTRPVASSKPKIPADLVGHPAQSHEQKPPKEIAHPVTALSSKTIGIDAKVGGPGQTDRNSGLMIDSAKKHSEGKKPSKRNLKPKTKHVKVIGDLAYSTHKVQHAPNQMSKKKSKAVPKPPVQSRTTRAAALAANEKIQNLVEHETSEERDQVEIPPEFKESRAGLDADSRMTTTNLSIGAIEDSRPLPNDSRKHEGQPMENDQTVPMKTVLPNEVSRTEKGLRTKNHKDADVLASESAHLIEGQLVHDTTDMPQRRGTASATKDSQDSSLDHVQSDLLNAQPIVPPRQANGTRRVLSDDDQPRLVTPGVFRQNTSLQSNEELPLADDDSAVIPETPALGDIDAPDGAGGGFFEEATTFSHEGTTAFLDNPVDEEIPEAFLPDDQHEIDHGYREVKDLKTSHALKAAKPSTIVATTTPKVSIAAKLQSALSSVENRYVQAVSQGISNKLLPFKAAPPSKDNGPGLNQSDQENTLPLEPNKDIVSKIQAIESASVQTGKGMINDKAVNHIHTNLPDLGITFDSSEPAPIVENGERKDSNIINETPPEPARTLLDTTRADQVVQKQGLENVEKDPEGVVLSALSRKSHLHSLPGNSTPDTNEIRKVDKAAKSKSQTTSFNGAKSAVALVGPPLDINRKSNIIGFDSRGPRNQGTLSSQKPQSTEVPENQTPLPRRTRKQILKRKLQGLDLDTLDLKHVVTTKRQRVSEDVPQKLEKFHEIAMRRESPARKESGRKTGSQSTRVHPNGSPMPFLHARTNALQGPPRHVSIDTTRLADGKQEIDDEDDFFMSGSRLEDLDTGSPSIQANPSPSAASVRFISSSSSKHRLTSPNASSGVINGYTAHQVYSRGKFVDIQTENVVMAMRPTDPFLEVEQDSSNSFINRLRRLSDNPREQNSFLRGPVRSEDPDKTLIETSSAHKKDHLRAASNLSTTSDFDSSQSKDSFPSEEASNSERCDDEDEWVKALQPHQGKLLDVLCEISQRLVRNLVSKETAVKDIISDYKRGGNRLIDRFEESRQQDLDAFQIRTKTLKDKLTRLYNTAQHEITAIRETQSSNTCAQVEARWQDHNRSMKIKLKEALALCTEEDEDHRASVCEE